MVRAQDLTLPIVRIIAPRGWVVLVKGLLVKYWGVGYTYSLAKNLPNKYYPTTLYGPRDTTT